MSFFVCLFVSPSTNRLQFVLEIPKACALSVSNTTIFNDSYISSYGAQLAQRASYLALYSSLFGPNSTVNYDYTYIVTSI